MKKGLLIWIFVVMMALLLAINASALCAPHAVQGRVLYRNGKPAMGADIVLTHVKTGATTTGEVEWDDGWYALDLGNLKGSCFSRGDLIKVTATQGSYSGTTTFSVSYNNGYDIPDTIRLSRQRSRPRARRISRWKRR